jgi:hypothetical protein
MERDQQRHRAAADDEDRGESLPVVPSIQQTLTETDALVVHLSRIVLEVVASGAHATKA